ncbi:hypothetical protein [Mesobacillus zeae]|uniref:Uncharacterized protein n=1 Tax=Mesobacillus zeae TaxID=1917180 RepID=A0A398BGK2_9BACI|nr:hypothetical protein [Mesobacillus zeae]RID88857.1 hypothetical protein D1970_01040 [Mesobacillus zeae]
MRYFHHFRSGYPRQYIQPFYQRRPVWRAFPPVNTAQFRQSAGVSLALFQDARKIMEKISASPSFSSRIMSAAQESKHSAVEGLILSTGVRNKPSLSFNPDGFTIHFTGRKNNRPSAELTIQLRWR